jgi:hypothetical protein
MKLCRSVLISFFLLTLGTAAALAQTSIDKSTNRVTVTLVRWPYT